MQKIWIAVICVGLLAAASLGMLFFFTAGSGWLADSLSAAAAEAGPEWNQRLYRWALELNPYQTASRLALAQIYEEEGQTLLSQQLLQEGVTQYNSGPELYLTLAASYTQQGRLEAACALLDSAPTGHLFYGLAKQRPSPPSAPASGTYPAGHPFYLRGTQGSVWFRLDDGEWTSSQEPLRLSEGDHLLKVLALSEDGIPSVLSQYRYRIEPVRKAYCPMRSFRYPKPAEIAPQ